MKIEDGLPLNPLDEPTATRVARGVALLDEKRPGWRTAVNPDTLDMTSDTDCVLGQLYGEYSVGLIAVGLANPVEATRYGFDARSALYMPASDAESAALAVAWREVLTGSIPA